MKAFSLDLWNFLRKLNKTQKQKNSTSIWINSKRITFVPVISNKTTATPATIQISVMPKTIVVEDAVYGSKKLKA